MVRKAILSPPGAVCEPNSKMRHTFGWVTRRASWISRLKRSRAVGADRLVRHALGELKVLDLVDLSHAALRQEAQHAVALCQHEARPESPRSARRLEPVGGRRVLQGVLGWASGGRPIVLGRCH